MKNNIGLVYEYIDPDQFHRDDGPFYETKEGLRGWALNGIILSKSMYFKKLEKLKGKEWADKIRLIYA